MYKKNIKRILFIFRESTKSTFQDNKTWYSFIHMIKQYFLIKNISFGGYSLKKVNLKKIMVYDSDMYG